MEPEVIDALQVMPGRDHAAAPRLAFALPESKFHPPGVRPGIVLRTALVERLAATQVPVITVAAPPGYGKTSSGFPEPLHDVAWATCGRVYY